MLCLMQSSTTKKDKPPETLFDFDEETVFELTHGDCWYLASTLRSRLKLPYVVIQGGPDATRWH